MSLLGDRLLDDRVGKAGLSGLDIVDARLERVTDGHEFVDFGNDAVLFGKGRQSNWKRVHRTKAKILDRGTGRILICVIGKTGCVDYAFYESLIDVLA